MLIGVIGTIGAGKGTFIEWLEQQGFSSRSLSDVIRTEARNRGLTLDRPTLQALGNELRSMHGPAVLMQATLRWLEEQEGPCVIDSIRHPAEAHLLRERGGMLIAVDANPRTRYMRVLERERQTGRTSDVRSYEAFLELEGREFTDDPASQQLHRVLEMSDVILRNDGSREDLFRQAQAYLSSVIRTQPVSSGSPIPT